MYCDESFIIEYHKYSHFFYMFYLKIGPNLPEIMNEKNKWLINELEVFILLLLKMCVFMCKTFYLIVMSRNAYYYFVKWLTGIFAENICENSIRLLNDSIFQKLFTANDCSIEISRK